MRYLFILLTTVPLALGQGNAVETNVVITSMLAVCQPPRYVLTLELRQVHYTLSLSEHLKDAVNAVTFDIPVDEAFYQSVKVGDRLSDKFRTGSLILHGSFGKWRVTVKAKREERQP